MTRAVILILLLAVAGGLFFTSYTGKPLAQSPDTSDGLATRRSFVVELHVVGVLDAAQSQTVSSNLRDSNGKIIYLINDGVQVEKGDVLVKLDPAPYENQVKKLEAEVASLEAAVQAGKQAVEFERNQVEREITNAEYNKNVANLDYKRIKDGDGPLKLSALMEDKDKAKLELQQHEAFYSDLLQLKEEGFDNQSEIVSEKENVAVYRERFQTASNRYANYEKHVLPALLEAALAKMENTALLVTQVTEGGKHKIAKAVATLAQIQSKLVAQKNALLRAQNELAKTTVVAPLDGIVIHSETFRDGQKRKPRVGDNLIPNLPILYLPDISKMVVKSRARELDLYKLELGQKGTVTIDAYPDQILQGTLSFIGALATNQVDSNSPEKFFQISFQLDNTNMKLRPGMTCRVKMVSKRFDDVLSVPLQAVFHKDDKKYCYLNSGLSGYVKTEVETGGQNEDYVEIISGLKEGDTISLHYPDSM